MGNINAKKIVIILLIIILAATAVIGKICYDNSRKYEVAQVTSIDYMLLIEDGRCGVINKSGNIVVSPVYDDIQIPNPCKPVFICMSNYNEDTKHYDITVLNEKAERILYDYVDVEAIYIEETTSAMPYDKTVLKYKKDGKWGLIDFNGKKITKPIYEDIKGIAYREGLLAVKKDSKYGIINIKGTTIVKSQFDDIKCDGYCNQAGNYNNAGFIVSNTTSNGYRFGYVNYNGKVILKPEYNDITRILDKKDDKNTYLVAFKNGMGAIYKNNKVLIKHEYEDVFYNKENDLLIMQKNSKQGVMNFNGDTIIPIEYQNIIISGKYVNAQKDENVQIFDIFGNKQNFNGYISISPTENENYNIAITPNDEYKIVDKSGNVITKDVYQSLKSIDGQNFIAQKDDKFGIIDMGENVKVNFEYDVIQVLNNTQIIQTLKLADTTTELYDFKLNKIVSVQKASIFVEGTYVKVLTDKNVQYYDYSGKEMKNTEIFNNSLYSMNKDGKWGFANKEGKVIVEPIYDAVTEFNSNGFAGIKKDGKWGSINSEGKIVIEPTYEIPDTVPEFVGQYYKIDYGYGTPYYTK